VLKLRIEGEEPIRLADVERHGGELALLKSGIRHPGPGSEPPRDSSIWPDRTERAAARTRLTRAERVGIRLGRAAGPRAAARG